MSSWWNADAKRVGTRHVQVFVPSVDRDGEPVPLGQAHSVEECLSEMGRLFGGATAFPPSRGVWRDDDRGGQLVYDDTVIVFSYVADEDLASAAGEGLHDFVMRLARKRTRARSAYLWTAPTSDFKILMTSSLSLEAIDK